MKIDEKSQNRPTYPQKGGNWLSEEDQTIVTDKLNTYQESFYNTFVQCSVFERYQNQDYGQTIAFAALNFERKPDAFASVDAVGKREHKDYKLLYDSVRIITLRISTFINECLIKLSQNAEQPEVRAELMTAAASLVRGTQLLYAGDRHIAANSANLKYSLQKFQDVLTAQKLTTDFQKLDTYLQQLAEGGASAPFDFGALENGKDAGVGLNEKNQEEWKAIQDRDWLAWTTL